jgi:uncharacterized spore protein YtfJ
MDCAGAASAILREIRGAIRSVAVTETAIRAGGRVFVTARRVSFGFGVCRRTGAGSKRFDAAGAGAKVEPVAVLVLGKGRPKLLPVREGAVSRPLFRAGPSLLGALARIAWHRRRGRC